MCFLLLFQVQFKVDKQKRWKEVYWFDSLSFLYISTWHETNKQGSEGVRRDTAWPVFIYWKELYWYNISYNPQPATNNCADYFVSYRTSKKNLFDDSWQEIDLNRDCFDINVSRMTIFLPIYSICLTLGWKFSDSDYCFVS